ncbi:MAG: hypothetical protein RR998_07620 [Oscillospiraceae bacterium]
MSNKHKNAAQNRHSTPWQGERGPLTQTEPEVAPAGSLVTQEEVIRNEAGVEDVHRLREWDIENHL